MSQTFYDISIVKDNDGENLFEIQTIIEVKFLKNNSEEAKPIKAEFIIRDGMLRKNVRILSTEDKAAPSIPPIEQATSSHQGIKEVNEKQIEVIDVDNIPTDQTDLSQSRKSKVIPKKQDLTKFKIPRVKPRIVRQIKIETMDARQIIKGKRVLLQSLLQEDEENIATGRQSASPEPSGKGLKVPL